MNISYTVYAFISNLIYVCNLIMTQWWLCLGEPHKIVMFSRSEIDLEIHTIFDAIRVMEDTLIALTIIIDIFRKSLLSSLIHIQRMCVCLQWHDPALKHMRGTDVELMCFNDQELSCWEWGRDGRTRVSLHVFQSMSRRQHNEWALLSPARLTRQQTWRTECSQSILGLKASLLWLMVLPTEAYVQL